MERRASTSRLHTIRGKIWIMVILLAVTNCVSGAVTFVGGSFLFSEAWIPVLLTILVSTATTVAFAWWISSDVLRPLDRLNLLAKSIERSPGMSVPTTTGAVETDDLLHTISRASRQLTNFIDLMDEVTAGNTQAALDPLEHSDRLSESFQKLVAKVTDSIDAKAELNDLQQAINQISSELSGLRQGESVRVRNEFPATRTISDALRFLIEAQTEIKRVVASNISEVGTLLGSGRDRISITIEKDLAQERKLKKLIAAISESHTEAERIMQKLAASLVPIGDLVHEVKAVSGSAEVTAKSQAAIRKQFEAAIHKLRDVGEQSLAITHVAKSVQDLARRSNMIAMNTSIHANGETAADFSTLTQEISSLSERAEKANKAIAGISDSVVRDVNEANASLQWVTTEVGKVTARNSKVEESLARISQVLEPLADLPAKIALDEADKNNKANRNLQTLEVIAAGSDEMLAELRSCEASFTMLQEPVDAIRKVIMSREHTLNPLGSPEGTQPSGNGHKTSNPRREVLAPS